MATCLSFLSAKPELAQNTLPVSASASLTVNWAAWLPLLGKEAGKVTVHFLWVFGEWYGRRMGAWVWGQPRTSAAPAATRLPVSASRAVRCEPGDPPGYHRGLDPQVYSITYQGGNGSKVSISSNQL